MHGWDPRSTLEATFPLGSTASQDRDIRRWRYGIKRQYQRARAVVNNRLREAIQDRADQHNQGRDLLDICSGSQVWLFLDRVKTGYARKPAHIWHGPFRVIDMRGDHAVKIGNSRYTLPRLPGGTCLEAETRTMFPDRPMERLRVSEADRVDFDESLLP